VVVFTIYLKLKNDSPLIGQLINRFSMLHLVPSSMLTAPFIQGSFGWTAEEYTYLTAVSKFIYYFINQRSEEYDALANVLKGDTINLGRLRLLSASLKREIVSVPRISEIQRSHGLLMKSIFADFEARTSTKWDKPPPTNAVLVKRINDVARTPIDSQIMNAMLMFNASVLKTNFYKRNKSSLSFRLDPSFLKDHDWPELLYGMIFVVGSDFHGFHIRFRDVARGGIRLIKSPSEGVYSKNLPTLFAENYGLAYTQNKKNKDIPEFGSKGTILLSSTSKDSFLAFQRYVSSIVDLLVAHPEVVDNYGKRELLFLGPDEGTADYMAWAANYARAMGYPFWRSFTTGKPPAMGGIPHDRFGMTTGSVHTYVLNCLEKMGLEESKVTKVQTGGPDGDLGSNEILVSFDMTKAIVDGSGVLFDPNGLDRTELKRLATSRSMISGFDTSLLKPGGFRVLVTEDNVALPNGEIVEKGMAFRNEFHLHPLFEADLFVPCGGRPESVTINNVQRLFKPDPENPKKMIPKFKIIVEGANLFFTQDARMELEKAGVVLYKDASANKGGVTSSSLEVLAALGLDDQTFDKHMAVKDLDNVPKFYKEYVEEIQQRISDDAFLEFDRIWKEHERTATPRHILTDQVSDKINQMTDFVKSSSLWNNDSLRRKILSKALPKKLQELVGLDSLLQRVPENYLQSIFATYLASRYVYKYGLASTEFSFFEFMDLQIHGE